MLVLVADDVQDSRQLLIDVISSMNFPVAAVANGFDVLEIARERQPDLIILDVNMPGMSGFEVMERLKEDVTTASIPVILLTALADIESRVHGFSLGADDYLTKPYNPRELMERVRTRLRTKHETDELRAIQQTIRNTFERYVAPTVVEQLLRDPSQVKLGGTLQEITVMFIDLEGFTSLSEQTDPEKLLAILNTYHTMIVNLIREHGGTVDKFMGDGVMALYNTPLPQPDHALRAVLTARHIRARLTEFHQQFEPLHQLPLNFGIHTGMAIIGNVGSPDLMNFTAVGDTVNIAARLQGLSEGGRILISSHTYQRITDSLRVRPLGEIQVKGRTEKVMTFEVL